jgi:hypothetical protein
VIRIETYDAGIDETIFAAISGYTAGIRPDSQPNEDPNDERVYKLGRFTWEDGAPVVEVEELEDIDGDYVATGRTRFFAVDDHIITIF